MIELKFKKKKKQYSNCRYELAIIIILLHLQKCNGYSPDNTTSEEERTPMALQCDGDYSVQVKAMHKNITGTVRKFPY